MIENKKEDYGYEINRYTRNIIEGLIPKRIVPFDYYEVRKIDEEVKNWLERSEGEFAVIVGDAGLGKTSLLCNLANELLNEEQYAVFFVKSDNLRGKDFAKKILDDLEITETGINAVLRKIIGKKIIFLLDTLDVIATDDGIARLDDFLTRVKGEKRVVIGASRPLEFKKIEHLTTKAFELKPFSDDEIPRLLDKYKACYNMEGVELRLPVLEVCRNPIHMRMLFEVHQLYGIPEDINVQKLYDRYWDKKIAVIRPGALSHLDEGKKRKAEKIKEDLAKNIASEMLASKQITLRQSDIRNIKDEMREEYSQSDTIIDDAYHDLLDEGVLREQEDLFEFFHQSFFEYAAARAPIENDDKEPLEYLLKNTTLLEYRAIIQQVVLYAKRKKKDEIAHRFLKELSETNFYTKILAIDLLKQIESITDKEVEIYQSLTRDEKGIRKYLGDSLKEVIPKHPRLATGLLETLSNDKDWMVRVTAIEALPELVEVNPEFAIELIETLRDEEIWVRNAAVKVLPKLVEVKPECAERLLDILKEYYFDFDCPSGIADRKAAFKMFIEVFPKFAEVNPGLTISSFLDVDYRTDSRHLVDEIAEAIVEAFEVNSEIAPRLIKILEGYSELDRNIALKALPKMVEVNPERAILLIKTLEDKILLNKDFEWVRPWGVEEALQKFYFEVIPKMVEVNPERAILLIETLKDKDFVWPSLWAVAEALPKLVEVKPELATRLIETFSKDKDSDVRKVVSALSKLVEVNQALLTRSIETFIKSDEWLLRRAAIKALPKLIEVNPELATRLIETFSKDKNSDVRKTIAETLPKLIEVNPELATGLIETFSKDKNSLVQKAVADALSKLIEVNPEFVTGLIEACSSLAVSVEDWHDILEEVQKAVADALSKLIEVNPELATGLIETFIGNEKFWVQEVAVKAHLKLIEVNPELATRLFETFRGGYGCPVAEPLLKLVEVNLKLATGLIETFSKDEFWKLRKAAAEALPKLAELYPQEARPLVEKLKDVEYFEIQKAIADISQQLLADYIRRDLNLLKEYEDEQRYETDPRRLARYCREIDRLRESSTRYHQEYDELQKQYGELQKQYGELLQKRYDELQKQVTGEPPPEMGDMVADLLRQMDAKLDNLQRGQKDIQDDLKDFRKTLLARFDASEQEIITVIVQRLDQNQLATVHSILDEIETHRVPQNKLQETLNAVQKALLEIKQKEGGLYDPQLVSEAKDLSDVVDNPKLDVNHKLKVSVPIIPLILSYETDVELKSGLNLKAAWQGLKAWVRGER